ncbi:MAG: hypothetical protein ACYDCL_02080 [Myxococcales bacterium]
MSTKLPTHIPVFIRALQASGKLQGEMAQVIGVSRRTMSRYVSAATPVLSQAQWNALADEVRSRDPDLALELAAMGDAQALAFGVGNVVIQRPVPPPPAAPALPPPPPPPKPSPHLDSALAAAVVYAAAEALDVSPRQVRPVIAAAFARAVELGCTVEQIARALAPERARPPDATAEGTSSTATRAE